MTEKFYVYRYVHGDFRNITFLGTFETIYELKDIYDTIFKIFAGDESSEGIFVRRRPIW